MDSKSFFSIAVLALVFCFVVACNKKNPTVVNNKVSLSAKIDCRDCFWTVQVGSKAIKQESRGDHTTTQNFEVTKGDTVLMFGYTYDVGAPMVGTILQGTTEIKKGTAHCNLNPSFFLQHIIAK